MNFDSPVTSGINTDATTFPGNQIPIPANSQGSIIPHTHVSNVTSTSVGSAGPSTIQGLPGAPLDYNLISGLSPSQMQYYQHLKMLHSGAPPTSSQVPTLKPSSNGLDQASSQPIPQQPFLVPSVKPSVYINSAAPKQPMPQQITLLSSTAMPPAHPPNCVPIPVSTAISHPIHQTQIQSTSQPPQTRNFPGGQFTTQQVVNSSNTIPTSQVPATSNNLNRPVGLVNLHQNALAGLIRPEQIHQMPHLNENMKQKYETGARTMWALIQSKRPGSNEYKIAVEKLIEATQRIRQGYKAWLDQQQKQKQAASQSGEKDLNSDNAPVKALDVIPPTNSSETSISTSRESEASNIKRTSTAKPKNLPLSTSPSIGRATNTTPNSTDIPMNAMCNGENFSLALNEQYQPMKFYLPPRMSADSDEGKKELKEYETTYYNALKQLENISAQKRQFQALIEQYQAQKQPNLGSSDAMGGNSGVQAALPPQYETAKLRAEKMFNQTTQFLNEFRARQQQFKLAAAEAELMNSSMSTGSTQNSSITTTTSNAKATPIPIPTTIATIPPTTGTASTHASTTSPMPVVSSVQPTSYGMEISPTSIVSLPGAVSGINTAVSSSQASRLKGKPSVQRFSKVGSGTGTSGQGNETGSGQNIVPTNIPSSAIGLNQHQQTRPHLQAAEPTPSSNSRSGSPTTLDSTASQAQISCVNSVTTNSRSISTPVSSADACSVTAGETTSPSSDITSCPVNVSSSQRTATPSLTSHHLLEHKLAIRMPIPATLPALASRLPTPISMGVGPSRPTLTGSIPGVVSTGGVISAPVIPKLPGFVLDSDYSFESRRVLSKKRLDKLVRQVTGVMDTSCSSIVSCGTLTPEAEEAMLVLADEFVDTVITSACQLTKLRNSTTLDVRDLQLVLERNYNIRIPGTAFGVNSSSPHFTTTSSSTSAHSLLPLTTALDDTRPPPRRFQPTPSWTQKMQAIMTAKMLDHGKKQ